MDRVLAQFFTAGQPLDSHLPGGANRWRGDARPRSMVHRRSPFRKKALQNERSHSVGGRPSREGSDSQPSRDPDQARSGGDTRRNYRHNRGEKKAVRIVREKGIMTPDLIGSSSKFP